MDLRGRVAVVTGGASGLGGHIKKALTRRGAHVVLGDLDAEAGDRAIGNSSLPAWRRP